MALSFVLVYKMASTPPTEPVSTPMMGPGPSQDEKTHAMLAWFLGPFIFLVPLIIFLISNEKPFAKRHAAMSLGFEILIVIVYGVTFVTCIGPIICMVLAIVVSIMGGMAANKGDRYDIPGVGPMIANIFKV